VNLVGAADDMPTRKSAMLHPILLAIRPVSQLDPDHDDDAAHDAYVELRRSRDFVDLPLLVRAARFRACDRARRRIRERRRRDFSLPIEFVPANAKDDAINQACLNEFSRALRTAVNRLPSLQRAIIMRHDLSGETLVKIADALGVPLATVKSRHRLALGKLRRDPIMVAYQP